MNAQNLVVSATFSDVHPLAPSQDQLSRTYETSVSRLSASHLKRLEKVAHAEIINKVLLTVQPGPRGESCDGQMEYFDVPSSESPKQKELREKVAKALCMTCPIIESCLEDAMKVENVSGIWGGTTDKERRGLRRRQSR